MKIRNIVFFLAIILVFTNLGESRHKVRCQKNRDCAKSKCCTRQGYCRRLGSLGRSCVDYLKGDYGVYRFWCPCASGMVCMGKEMTDVRMKCEIASFATNYKSKGDYCIKNSDCTSGCCLDSGWCGRLGEANDVCARLRLRGDDRYQESCHCRKGLICTRTTWYPPHEDKCQ